jgi:tetratricopeptide (TPR) repeat protein
MVQILRGVSAGWRVQGHVRHVLCKGHRCLRTPGNPQMTQAAQRSVPGGLVRAQNRGSERAEVEARPCEFEFLLRTGGRQHTARGDCSEDFLEMQPARALAAKGKDHQALAAYERVAEQRREDPQRGPHHPETLRAYMSLGNYQRKTGRTGAAADSYRAVIQGRAATLGPRHVETLAARFTLAGLLKDLKELGAAVKEYEETVAGYVETLGERHTATLDAMYGLAILLQQQQALKTSSGATPPKKLTGLAKIRAEKELRERNAAMKRQHEAGGKASGIETGEDRVQSLYEKVVDGYTAQLGARHTETLRAQYNLALCLKQNKQLEHAQSMYEGVVGGWLAQLGPRHAHTLHAQYGLALVLRDRGLTAAARTACQEVVEGYGMVYGSLHPLTITAQKAAQALR